MKLPPRTRRWLIVAALLFGLFSLAGFFLLPVVLKAQLEKRLTAELGRSVTVETVRFNPYVLSLALENFNIREKNAATSFLGWSRLYVNFDALASFGGDWVLSEIQLDGFHAAVTINPDASLNFSDLLAKFAPPATAAPAAKPARPVRVGNLSVTQARVDFSDRSRPHPFSTVVGPLAFALTEFRTAGERGAPYYFAASTEAGEKLSWRGTLAADPFGSKGEFKVENIILKKYTPYFEDRLRANLTDGKLTAGGRYEINFAANRRALKLNDAQLQLRDFRLDEPAGTQPAVELRSLDITGVQADGVTLQGSINAIALAGGYLHVRREKDGSVNLLNLLRPDAPSPTPPAPAATPVKSPDITVGEITLKDFAINLDDLAAPRPARLALGNVQVSLKNLSLAEGAAMPLDLSFAWTPGGATHVTGTLTAKPNLTADLKTEVTALEILPLSPYLEQFADVRLTSGAVSSTNTLRLSLAGGNPALDFAGDIKVEKLGLVDGAHNEELAGFASLELNDLKATTAPHLTVSLGEVKLAAPYARVVVNADQSINLAAIAKSAPPSPETPPATTTPAPKIEIARVVLADGEFSFTDRSIEPNVRVALSQFGGTIAGLSSENFARADVELKGSVDNAGPVAITGKLDPLGARKFVDVKLDFKNVDLLPTSPYMGKYAGYELARGKLLVDTKFLLDGKKIEAANVVTLNQFNFGTATNSPDATSLPVRLGVALLKDIDGKIVIDLPIQGSLDDPNFRVGKIVMRVVVNLLTKAATSPFSLIGSMFGGGGDELAYQEFSPGSSELRPSELPKLATLTKALVNRPALNLGLEGGYDVAADTYELKRQKLTDVVRRKVWEARHATDPNIPPPEQLVISPEEHAAMVKKLFEEKFPPGTQFGTPLPPAPAVAAPPPAPSSVFKRFLNTITFTKQRQQRAAERENERRAAEHEKAAAAAIATGRPFEEMTGRLAETMAINESDLRALAAARAQRVRDYLVGTGPIAADRLFLTQNQNATKPNQGPRVFLSLQ